LNPKEADGDKQEMKGRTSCKEAKGTLRRTAEEGGKPVCYLEFDDKRPNAKRQNWIILEPSLLNRIAYRSWTVKATIRDDTLPEITAWWEIFTIPPSLTMPVSARHVAENRSLLKP
jgi:hypothetical protein